MKTGNISSENLAASVLVVPPLARSPDLSLNRPENSKLIAHIENGGATTLLYGGNANFYHIALSEYAATLDFLGEAVHSDTWLIPSAGPDYGRLMDQAPMLRDRRFPTAMVLPNTSPGTVTGTMTALRRFAERFQHPIILYVKTRNYLPPESIAKLVRDKVVFAVKYAVVCPDPGRDDYLQQLQEHISARYIVSGLGELPAVVHLQQYDLVSFTTGSGAIAPRASNALLRALKEKDYDQAQAIRDAFLPLEDFRNRISPIRVLHEAVRLCEIADTGPILPFLHNLDEDDHADVQIAAQGLLAYEQPHAT